MRKRRFHKSGFYIAFIYLFKVNCGNTETMCEIYSELTGNKPDDLVPMSSLLTLEKFYIF